MRAFYLLVVYLVSPLIFTFWVIRGCFDRSYFDRLGQRFGFGVPQLENSSIWLHAVSVGEVQAAIPLVGKLSRKFPQKRIVLSTVTPTGAQRVAQLFGDSVVHCYAPFETNGAIQRFFKGIKPDLALILETEIWPNLYHHCGRHGIPLVLASARISPRSVNSYKRLVPLFREALSHGIVIAAQSAADAGRFHELGAAKERTFVTGNIKFDMQLDGQTAARGRDFRERHFPGRPVWIAASTHAQEEEILLDAAQRVSSEFPDLLTVIVPRHPQRFDAVANVLRKRGLNFIRRTSGRHCASRDSIFLGDTMGELPMLYAGADIAFVGGSLAPIGGHNLLEPAALGLPILIGPHVFNAEDISKMFTDSGAAQIVTNADQLATQLIALFHSEPARTEMGERGREILRSNRGALDRLLSLVEPLINPPPETGPDH